MTARAAKQDLIDAARRWVPSPHLRPTRCQGVIHHEKSGVSLNETHPASKSLSSCVLNVRFQRTYWKRMLSIHMLGLRSRS